MTAVTWNSTFGQFLFRIISRVVLPTNLAKEQKYLNRNPGFEIFGPVKTGSVNHVPLKEVKWTLTDERKTATPTRLSSFYNSFLKKMLVFVIDFISVRNSINIFFLLGETELTWSNWLGSFYSLLHGLLTLKSWPKHLIFLVKTRWFFGFQSWFVSWIST